MADTTNLYSTINDLLNRDFKIPDIKQHLLNNGFVTEDIETAITETVAARAGNSKNAVSSTQGSRGIAFMISGALILLSFLVFRNSAAGQGVNIIRGLLGASLLLYGFNVSNRPLKDE
jgi:hypothetical protein